MVTILVIKYVGIKTAEEAEQVRKNFVEEINNYNDEIIADRNRSWLIVTILAIVVSVSVYFFHYDAQFDFAAADFGAFGLIAGIWLAINFFILVSCHDEMRSDWLWMSPASYQFFKATQNKTLLKTEIRYNANTGKRDLVLALQDSNNEVSYDFVYGLDSTTKTDIKDTVIDLDRGVVMMPYNG
jgi:hypothetical protein